MYTILNVHIYDHMYICIYICTCKVKEMKHIAMLSIGRKMFLRIYKKKSTVCFYNKKSIFKNKVYVCNNTTHTTPDISGNGYVEITFP